MLSYRRALLGFFLLVSGLGLATAQPVPAPPAALAEPGIPNMLCRSPILAQWDNCVGTFTYPNGNVYRGEFHHGLRDGFGIIVINAKGVSDANNILSNEHSIYLGEFRRDKLNGHGIWFTDSGAGYSGSFVNNIPQADVTQKNCSGRPSPGWTNCVAVVRYGNGNVYRGEFLQGQREGIGMIQIEAIGAPDSHNIRTPEPGVYVGGFRGNQLNGRGVILMPGSGFFGAFAENLFASSAALPSP